MTVHSGLVCARGWPERAGSCPGDEGGGLLGGVPSDLGQHRGVGVGGDRDGGVPQQLGDDLQVGAGGEGEGGHAVPQVVQPDRGKVGGGDQSGELVGDVGRVQRLPGGGGERRSPRNTMRW